MFAKIDSIFRILFGLFTIICIVFEISDPIVVKTNAIISSILIIDDGFRNKD